MKVTVLPAVVEELREASTFYAERADKTLGLALVSEFERALNFLSINPEFGAVWRGTARRFTLHRFPYNLVYRIKSHELQVIALAHQRRRPSYWQSRS